MKICVSISTYNAIEDLHIAAKIVRSNWPKEHELYIITGLCNPESINKINKNYFDNYLKIETPPTPSLAAFEGDSGLVGQYSRNLNSIFQTGKSAIQKNCDYIIYLNSGSWPLDPLQIIKLAEEIGDRTFGVQICNRMKYFFPEDHFLMVNLAKANLYKIFEFDYASRPFNPISLVANGIHGMLACWLNQVPYGEVHVYSNHTNSIDAFGNRPFTLIPLIFNPDYKFLHSNSRYGFTKYLRQEYLKKYVKIKPAAIAEYITSDSELPQCYKLRELPYPHLREKLRLKRLMSLTKNVCKMVLNPNSYTSEFNFWDCMGVNTQFSNYDKRLVK